MCGIAGVFSYNSDSQVNKLEIKKMCDYMYSRGPDSSGDWYSENNIIGLGHRRLSIIDLSSGGLQPMTLANQNLKAYKALENKEIIPDKLTSFNSE